MSTITQSELKRRAKIGQASKMRWQSEEYREWVGQKISHAQMGKRFTKERKQNISISKRGKPTWLSLHRNDPEIKAKRDQKLKGRKFSEAACQRMSEVIKQQWQNPERRRKFCESMKRLWSDPERARRWRAAQGAHPNKGEELLISLISEHGLPLKYVGNGDFIIGGKNPDFVNINGKKQVIELFGDYIHDIFDIAERTQHFARYGFDTLIIWHDELKNEPKLLKKLKRFTNKRKQLAFLNSLGEHKDDKLSK